MQGYIVKTDGAYSLLKIGDITNLKKEDASVMVRMLEAKKEKPAGKKNAGKSTDSLTSAGYKLFEKLRKLRLAIAKEEALPPYIIFSDKTLLDMCAKTPKNRREMLTVSGVGENKFSKYGQRFLKEIEEFGIEHPNAAVSLEAE